MSDLAGFHTTLATCVCFSLPYLSMLQMLMIVHSLIQHDGDDESPSTM